MGDAPPGFNERVNILECFPEAWGLNLTVVIIVRGFRKVVIECMPVKLNSKLHLAVAVSEKELMLWA